MFGCLWERTARGGSPTAHRLPSAPYVRVPLGKDGQGPGADPPTTPPSFEKVLENIT